jgi:RNA polymerase sigma factor (sigma-70 family)
MFRTIEKKSRKQINREFQNQPDNASPTNWEVIDGLIKDDDLYGLYRQDIQKFIAAYKDLNTIELAKSYKTVRAVLNDWFGQESVTTIFGKTKAEFLTEASIFRFQLILKNLRLVIYFAKKKFHGFGNQDTVSFMDVVQAGNIGLITAVEKFDPDRGNEFATYAGYWINQAIDRYGIYPMDTSIDLKESGRPLIRQIYSYHEHYVQEKSEWIDISNPVFLTAAYEYLKELEQFSDLSYELVLHIIGASQRVLSIEGLTEEKEDEYGGNWEKRMHQLGVEYVDQIDTDFQKVLSKTLSPEHIDTLYTLLGSILPAKELEAIQIWHMFGTAFEQLSLAEQVDDTYIRDRQRKLLTTYNKALSRLKMSKAFTAFYQEIESL